MTDKDLDRLIREASPKVEITPERLECLMTAVLAQIPDAKPSGWLMWKRKLLDLWDFPAPVLAYALPVVVALWLGIVTGGALLPSSNPVNLDPWVSLLHSADPLELLEM